MPWQTWLIVKFKLILQRKRTDFIGFNFKDSAGEEDVFYFSFDKQQGREEIKMIIY